MSMNCINNETNETKNETKFEGKVTQKLVDRYKRNEISKGVFIATFVGRHMLAIPIALGYAAANSAKQFAKNGMAIAKHTAVNVSLFKDALKNDDAEAKRNQ